MGEPSCESVQRPSTGPRLQMQERDGEGSKRLSEGVLPSKRLKVKWQRYRKERRAWKNQNLLNNVLTNFKRHLKKAGIEPEEGKTLSVQTLRKSCIQNWANNITNPEVVRVLAGHSDLKTTMQYYCQIDSDQRAKAAAAIDNLLEQNDARSTFW